MLGVCVMEPEIVAPIAQYCLSANRCQSSPHLSFWLIFSHVLTLFETHTLHYFMPPPHATVSALG